MADKPKPEGTMSFISKIVNFLKDLLDLILGKSHGDPSVNPDGGTVATGSQSQAQQQAGQIASDSTQGVNTTPDGGIVYDKDGKPVQKKKDVETGLGCGPYVLLFLVPVALICASCFEIKVGTQKIDVYEQYPVYTIEPKPVLMDLTADDNDPHKAAALLAQKIMADGVVTADEKKLFDGAMAAAELARVQALNKKVANDRSLLKWGRTNQATLEIYNVYASDKNERIKVQESSVK
jgi:hypothetical protein